MFTVASSDIDKLVAAIHALAAAMNNLAAATRQPPPTTYTYPAPRIDPPTGQPWWEAYPAISYEPGIVEHQHFVTNVQS